MRRNLKPHVGRVARPWSLALAVLVTAAGLCLGGVSAVAGQPLHKACRLLTNRDR